MWLLYYVQQETERKQRYTSVGQNQEDTDSTTYNIEKKTIQKGSMQLQSDRLLNILVIAFVGAGWY